MKKISIVAVIVVSVMSYVPSEAMGEIPPAIALPQNGNINQENLPATIIERHEAAALTTEPVTINSQWNSVTRPTQNLQETSISLEQKKGCESLSPLELLNNPDALFQECVNPTDNRTPQRVEPVEYLKVPGLDSGVKVNVTKF